MAAATKKDASSNTTRVLIVTPVLWRGGGAERVAAYLGNYLTDEGYETHLLTFYEAKEKFPYHGIYHSFNEGAKKNWLYKLPNIPLRIWKIHRYAQRHNIDVIYAFLEEGSFYTLTAKILFFSKRRVIVSVRNNTRRLNTIMRIASRLLYPVAYRVVAVTRHIEEMLKQDFHLQNTTTIYNPIDITFAKREAQQPLPDAYRWLTNTHPLLVTIARLVYQKGQWHLIRAFTEVSKHYPDAHLLILGEGDYHTKLVNFAQTCGVEHRVHLIGNQANVHQFLTCGDLFVFSSLFEGMSNTILEGLSVGLPIVSPDCVSGPREIVAPDVPVTATLAYPHRTPYGTLTAPLEDKECWQSPDDVPLTDAEAQLRDAILTHLKEGFVKGEHCTAYKKRIDAFAHASIMREWEELLTA